ncbi:MAG: CoA-binding protein [Spirochaetaceae bacterium]|nr:MAG: CoA-binding protein [Spirochaetaceae bacterium]
MTARKLDRLFRPSSVAVVGATESAGKPGRTVMENLLRGSVTNHTTVFPVHPSRTDVFGVPAFRSVRDLPTVPDVVVVAVGAEAAVEATEQSASLGVPFVIVLAGGFGESGAAGRALEDRLASAIARTRTRVLGPNTIGLQVPATGFDTVFVRHATDDVSPDGAVFISQSGSVAVEAIGEAARHGFRLGCFIGLGNALDLSTVDFIRHFTHDPVTSCLCVYLEHLGEGRDLLVAAHAASCRMPVFFLKAGRTRSGAAAVASHTGRLAGSDRVVDGAFRRHGIQRVVDDQELIDAARVVTYARIPRGGRVAIVTPAGGYGVMCADYIEGDLGRGKLSLARLSAETEERLSRVCLPFACVHNPVDITAGANTESFSRVIDIVLEDPEVDIVIVLAFFAPSGITRDLVDRVAASAHSRVATENGKSLVVFCRFGADTEAYCRAFTDAGLAAFDSLSRTVRAARILVERAEFISRNEASSPFPTPKPITAAVTPPADGRIDPAGSAAAWLARFTGGSQPHEADVKELLRSVGLCVPDGSIVAAGCEIAQPEFPGPYAVKVVSAEMFHKTEHGALRLGVGADELPGCIDELRALFPGAAVLVEKMVHDVAIELIVGAICDPDLGLALMIGAGGIHAEIHRDTVFELLPLDSCRIDRMLRELRIAPILDGYRGIAIDREALVRDITRIAELAGDLGDRLIELDLNPVCFAAGNWVALDAKMKVS